MGLAFVGGEAGATEISPNGRGPWPVAAGACVCQACGYETGLWVADRTGHVRVAISQIQRIEAAKDYAIIHAAGHNSSMSRAMAK